MRNAVNDGREHKSLVMTSRLATISRTALTHLAVEPQPGTTAIEVVRLQDAHMLTKVPGPRRAVELYLREAQSGEEAVRMMFEAVRIVSAGERTTATAFAHDAIEGAKSGDWLEMAEQLLVPLSPRAQESGLSTTQSLAWLRSKSTEEMLKKVETRLRQMVARNIPGGTRRDVTQSSPARTRQRTDAGGDGATAAAASMAAPPTEERRMLLELMTRNAQMRTMGMPMIPEDTGTAPMAGVHGYGTPAQHGTTTSLPMPPMPDGAGTRRPGCRRRYRSRRRMRPLEQWSTGPKLGPSDHPRSINPGNMCIATWSAS